MSFLFRKKNPEDQKLIAFVRDGFGFTPKKLALYKEAIRHKSAAVEIKEGVKNSNERLEYLGDAVLDTIVADYLFRMYPFKDEGFLTKLRSKIVSRAQLNELAKKLKIEDVLDVNFGKAVQYKSLEGNALEAIIGAVYLEKGFEFTRTKVIDNLLNKHLNITALEKLETNPKSRLLEWAQKERRKVSFRVANEKDYGYRKHYEINLLIDGTVSGSGAGASKKEAEQAAARNCWEQMFPK